MIAALAAVILASCAGGTSPRDSQGLPQATSFRFDERAAWAHLIKQCDFGPRVPGTDAHKKCRDFIADEMRKHCENVRLQEFAHRWSQTGVAVTMWNLIGEQNWKEASVRVLLLAHWDTRPFADQDFRASYRSKPIPGANDGASGVAVLLELMRAMKGKLPKGVGVMYLMTDGEDLGPSLGEMFLGAEHFAKNLPSPKPDYGILLDMIGDRDLEIPMEPNSVLYARDLVNAFYRNAERIGLGATFPRRFGPTIEDDHIPLNKAGIPTIDLIDFEYPYWHTADDNPEKCSAESLGKVGKALESWLLQEPPFRMPARS